MYTGVVLPKPEDSHHGQDLAFSSYTSLGNKIGTMLMTFIFQMEDGCSHTTKQQRAQAGTREHPKTSHPPELVPREHAIPPHCPYRGHVSPGRGHTSLLEDEGWNLFQK